MKTHMGMFDHCLRKDGISIVKLKTMCYPSLSYEQMMLCFEFHRFPLHICHLRSLLENAKQLHRRG
jgi:hypothetical protein